MDLRLDEKTAAEIRRLYGQSDLSDHVKNVQWFPLTKKITVHVEYKAQNYFDGKWRKHEAFGEAEVTYEYGVVSVSFKHHYDDAHHCISIECSEVEHVEIAKQFFALEMHKWARMFEWRF